MNLTTLIAAATEAENHGHSETLFIVMGIVLALFAVVVSTAGIRKPDLPDSATRAITALGAVLVVLTMASMVVIST
jgi:membrane-anchored protein YejM (alkaline phosphatase superfamily)